MNSGKKMRICFVAHDLDVKNGWGRSIFMLAAGVKDTGHEVYALTRESSGLEFERAIISESLIGSSLRIRKFLKNCDVINAHDVWPYGVAALFANLGIGKKIILTAHGTYSLLPFYEKGLKGCFQKFLAKIVLRRADKVIAVSRHTAREVNRFVPEVKIEVIHWGVDVDEFQKFSSAGTGQRIEVPVPYILSVGAIKERKGYHVSIEAFALIKDKFPDLKYVIVGFFNEGDVYKKKLDGIISERGLEGRVFFFKNLSEEELSAFYRNAEFFILTSVNETEYIFEGFGLVYLEAGANGKAVIGTFDCGAEDAIENNATGLLVRQGDVRGTAEAMEKFLKDKPFADKTGEKGFLRAKNMSWPITINKYCRIFSGAYAKKSD